MTFIKSFILMSFTWHSWTRI